MAPAEVDNNLMVEALTEMPEEDVSPDETAMKCCPAPLFTGDDICCGVWVRMMLAGEELLVFVDVFKADGYGRR